MNVLERGPVAQRIDRKTLGEAIREGLGLQPLNIQLGMEIARGEMERGATAEAFRIYIGLVLCDPCDPALQVELATCALRVKQHELALQAASVVVALSPSDPRGHFLSGLACLALGHLAEAKEDLTNAVAFGRRTNTTPIVVEAEKLLTELAATAA